MSNKSDSVDSTPVAATVNRWAFAALLGGNLALSLTALVVRFADTGPVAAGLWRLLLALPVLLLLMRRETGGRLPSPRALWIATGAGLHIFGQSGN